MITGIMFFKVAHDIYFVAENSMHKNCHISVNFGPKSPKFWPEIWHLASSLLMGGVWRPSKKRLESWRPIRRQGPYLPLKYI